MDREVGSRDDVDLKTQTPDYNSRLRLLNPDVEWDGPSQDPSPSDVCLLSAPPQTSASSSDDPDLEDPRSWAEEVFARCKPEEVEAMTMSGWSQPSTYLVSAVDTDASWYIYY